MTITAVAGPRSGRATPSLREARQQHSTTETGRRPTYPTPKSVRTIPATALVTDYELGFRGECSCDANALALASAKLMGVTLEVLGVERNPLQELTAALRSALAAPLGAMDLERFANDSATLMPGFSELNGSWKIVAIFRRQAMNASRDRPLIRSPR